MAGSILQSQIYAIISQAPHLDFGLLLSNYTKIEAALPYETMTISIQKYIWMTKLLVIGLCDKVAEYLQNTPFQINPFYIPIFGTIYSQLSYLPLPKNVTIKLESFGYNNKTKLKGNWQNLAPARSLLTITNYNPISYISFIQSPVLLIGVTQDTVTPLIAIENAYRMVSN